MTVLTEQFPELDNIVSIPIPFNEVPYLFTANIYALGRGEITLVDAGPGIPGAIEFVKDAFNSNDLQFRNIKRIILTHGHMDHFGLVPDILGEIGHDVDIYLHPEDIWKVSTDFFSREVWLDELDWLRKLTDIPDNILVLMKKGISRYYSIASPIDGLKPMEDGDEFSGDGYNLRVLYTPGHSPGLCCLYETGKKVLFSSDHILKNLNPKPIMPLSRETLRDKNYKSLMAYENSLKKVSSIDVRYLLPGHGEWIQDMNPIIKRYIEHNAQRMELVWKAVRKRELPLYHLVNDVFSHAEKEDLFIALSEIFSHLEVLVHQGRAEIIKQGPPVIYRALDS